MQPFQRILKTRVQHVDLVSPAPEGQLGCIGKLRLDFFISANREGKVPDDYRLQGLFLPECFGKRVHDQRLQEAVFPFEEDAVFTGSFEF